MRSGGGRPGQRPSYLSGGSGLAEEVPVSDARTRRDQANKQAVIGQGKASIDTGDPKNTFWSEPADLGGAGTVAPADMLWDASSKIFYAFSHISLRCTHGKVTEADVLIGMYAKRNVLSRTPGTGWWVVELAQNQCQAPLAGLYGCKFDAQGNNLACGRAELDPRLNDMSIVEATRF